jgi:hypothetical protein
MVAIASEGRTFGISPLADDTTGMTTLSPAPVHTIPTHATYTAIGECDAAITTVIPRVERRPEPFRRKALEYCIPSESDTKLPTAREAENKANPKVHSKLDAPKESLKYKVDQSERVPTLN